MTRRCYFVYYVRDLLCSNIKFRKCSLFLNLLSFVRRLICVCTLLSIKQKKALSSFEDEDALLCIHKKLCPCLG